MGGKAQSEREALNRKGGRKQKPECPLHGRGGDKHAALERPAAF